MNGAKATAKLQKHPVFTRQLPGQWPLTYREYGELGEEKACKTEGASEAIRALPEWSEANKLIDAIGQAQYVPAVPLLSQLWLSCPVIPIRGAAGHALFAIGTPDAHAALQSALGLADSFATFMAMKSIITTDPLHAYDQAAQYLSDESVAAPGLAQVANEILVFFQPRKPIGIGDERWVELASRLLREDDRWVRRALELRDVPEVDGSARALLSALSRDELDAALDRWPDPPPPPRLAYSGRRDFVSRYSAGEFAQVWQDLRTASELDEPALRAEAEIVAGMTMQRVRFNVELITQRLKNAGYPFDGFAPPWSPPPKDVTKHIERIEKAARGPCPIALKAFWTVVGQVNWKHADETVIASAPWGDFPIAEADPLCIDGAELAWISVETWLEWLEQEHPAVVGPLRIELAPDYLHKANISGGPPYSVRVPGTLADPLFECEEHELTFVDYLRLCFRFGGFSRIDKMRVPSQAADFIRELSRGLEPF